MSSLPLKKRGGIHQVMCQIPDKLHLTTILLLKATIITRHKITEECRDVSRYVSVGKYHFIFYYHSKLEMSSQNDSTSGRIISGIHDIFINF